MGGDGVPGAVAMSCSHACTKPAFPHNKRSFANAWRGFFFDGSACLFIWYRVKSTKYSFSYSANFLHLSNPFPGAASSSKPSARLRTEHRPSQHLRNGSHRLCFRRCEPRRTTVLSTRYAWLLAFNLTDKPLFSTCLFLWEDTTRRDTGVFIYRTCTRRPLRINPKP
jgi:hypothetical protein